VEELSKSIQVIRALKQILGMMKQTIRHQYKDVNLTGPQGMLIGMLAHFGKMKISDLSEKLGLSNSTVSGILDRLEKTGLVERTRSEEDRRVVYVNVTPKFKKVSEQQFKEIEQNFVEKVSRANPEELDKILEGLNTLKEMLN
jgi:MarR family transcriptional regulator, organic hydroperoxide resistance regulator